MDSRTLVKRTLTFDRPARVPRHLWVLPWASNHYPTELAAIRERFPDDITSAPGCYRTPPRTQGDAYAAGTYVDEWGCTFTNFQPGVIGEVKDPLVPTWERLDDLHPPVAALSVDVEQVNAFCRATDRFVVSGCCARPFERMQFIRGSQNLYVDLGEDRPEFHTLLERVHGFYMKEMELWAGTDVDALNFMDDWGAQRALLISPRMWRRLFKPLYKEYVDLAHAHGKFAFMHSDGYIADIYPDLVEIGVDAINSQLFCMDIEDLGRKFAGKITFWGEIDRQHLLPAGSPAEIDAAVRRAAGALWRQGGAIAQCEFGPGARPENVAQVFETWSHIA